MPKMTSTKLLAIGLALVIGVGLVRAQGGGSGHGLVAVGDLGGVARALEALPQGGMLLAEGEALLHLADDGQIIARAALSRGAIQAVEVRGQLAYVLTEQGVSTVTLADLTEIAFQPGGGQALQVGGQAVYVAARAAGLRVGALDRRGLPGAWTVLPTPAPALDLALDGTGRFLYVAQGMGGIGIYALPPDSPPQITGGLTDIGMAERVAVAGLRLLVTTGHRVLAFDLTEPVVPRSLTTYAPLHAGADVLVRHEWAYVADQEGGLRRFAIGTLSDPRPEVDPLWQGAVHALAQDTRYLYAAAGWDGIVVLDAGRLDSIRVDSQVALPGEVTTLAVTTQGDQPWALAGLGADGIAVIDWRDSAAPQITARLTVDAPVRAVALRDGIGFVGLESGVVQVYSLNNLAAPRLLAALPLNGIPQGFALDGTLLYVAAGAGGLAVVETIRPAEPVVVGEMPPLRPDQPILDVTLEGGKRAYLSTGQTLIIADVDVLSAPQVLATLELPANAAVARNFIVYVAGGSAFATVNAASSNQPVQLGAYHALERIQALAAEGTTVWLGGSGPQVMAVQLALSGRFVEAQAVGLDGGLLAGRDVVLTPGGTLLLREDGRVARVTSSGVETVRAGLLAGDTLVPLAGDRAFVAGQGWAVLDLTAAGQSRVLVAGQTNGPILDAQAGGGALVLAQGARGVTVLPDPPDGVAGAAVTWIPAAGAGISRAAAIRDGFVFVAEAGPQEAGALRVLAEAPLESVAAVPLPGPAHAVALAGARAYVGYATQAGGGLAVLDVSAPTGGLETLGISPLVAQVIAVDQQRSLAYAVSGATLSVLDLTTWPQIATLAEVALPQAMDTVRRVGDRFLVATGRGTVLLLDLTRPDLPQPVAVVPGAVQAVEGSGTTLYLGSVSRGLAVADLRSLVALEDRVQSVDSQPVHVLWQADDLLFAGGVGALWAYDVSDPLNPVRVATLSLEGGPLTALAGIEDRRGGYSLYAVKEGRLFALRYTPGEAAGFSPVTSLGDGVGRLLGVTEQAVLTVGQDGALQFWALAGSQAVDWRIRYPLPGGAVLDGVLWHDQVLVGTARGVSALQWRAGAAAPPRVLGVLEAFESVPETLLPGDDGLLWLGNREGVWQVDARDPARLAVVNERYLPDGGYDLASLPGDDTLIVAGGACGVRLLQREPLQEVGFWDADRPVAAVVGLPDGRITVAGEGVLTVLQRVPANLEPVALPTLPQPSPDALLSESPTVLRWQTPVDGCAPVQYEVWLGQGSEPLARVGVVETPQFTLQDVPLAATVRWQIKVVEDSGRVVEGPLWAFSTDQARVAHPTPVTARIAAATPTPIADQAEPGAESRAPAAGINARTLLPVLLGGVVLEIILVAGLWMWWRSRRRMQ